MKFIWLLYISIIDLLRHICLKCSQLVLCNLTGRRLHPTSDLAMVRRRLRFAWIMSGRCLKRIEWCTPLRIVWIRAASWTAWNQGLLRLWSVHIEFSVERTSDATLRRTIRLRKRLIISISMWLWLSCSASDDNFWAFGCARFPASKLSIMTVKCCLFLI